MNRELDMYRIFLEELIPMAASLGDFTGRLAWKHWAECLDECCATIGSFLDLFMEYPEELIEDVCSEAFRRGAFSIAQVFCILRKEVVVKMDGSTGDLSGQLQFDF
jgi:hypothetical protein